MVLTDSKLPGWKVGAFLPCWPSYRSARLYASSSSSGRLGWVPVEALCSQKGLDAPPVPPQKVASIARNDLQPVAMHSLAEVLPQCSSLQSLKYVRLASWLDACTSLIRYLICEARVCVCVCGVGEAGHHPGHGHTALNRNRVGQTTMTVEAMHVLVGALVECAALVQLEYAPCCGTGTVHHAPGLLTFSARVVVRTSWA